MAISRRHSTFILLLLQIALSETSPVPQDTGTTTAAPTPTSRSASPSPSGSFRASSGLPPTDSSGSSFDGGSTHIFNVYYITAVCAGVAVFVLIVGAGLYRYKMRQRVMADGYYMSDLNSRPAPRTRQQQRPKKKRVVLTEDQFNMLPCEVAQGSLSTTATTAATKETTMNKSALEGGHKEDSGDAPDMKVVSSEGMSVDSGEGHHRWKEPETCAVCLDDVSHGDKLVYLQCEHAFHVNCARPWFLQKSTLCPLCKKDTLESLGLKRPKSVRDDSSDTENEAAITTAALPPMAGETAQAVPGESVAAAAVPRDEVEARPPSYSEAASPQTEATAGNDSQQALANPQPARLAGQPTTQAHF